MDKQYDDRYVTRRRDQGEQMRHERKVLCWFGALIVMGFVAGQALATPWTDENGNPNPECLSTHCHETGVKDKPLPRGDDHAPELAPDTPHAGFSCYFAPWGAWVYHAAARPNMTLAHDDAAKGEALDRLERLGVAVAMTKVCRKWQTAAGFKIAKVL